MFFDNLGKNVNILIGNFGPIKDVLGTLVSSDPHSTAQVGFVNQAFSKK